MLAQSFVLFFLELRDHRRITLLLRSERRYLVLETLLLAQSSLIHGFKIRLKIRDLCRVLLFLRSES